MISHSFLLTYSVKWDAALGPRTGQLRLLDGCAFVHLAIRIEELNEDCTSELSMNFSFDRKLENGPPPSTMVN